MIMLTCSYKAVPGSRGVVPELSRAAGKVICISSVHQAIPWARHANWAASKVGVTVLTQTMAQELAVYRIRANAIAPGPSRPVSTAAPGKTPQVEQELL